MCGVLYWATPYPSMSQYWVAMTISRRTRPYWYRYLYILFVFGVLRSYFLVRQSRVLCQICLATSPLSRGTVICSSATTTLSLQPISYSDFGSNIYSSLSFTVTSPTLLPTNNNISAYPQTLLDMISLVAFRSREFRSTHF